MASKKQINPFLVIFTGAYPMPLALDLTDKLLKNYRIIWEDKSTDTESNVKNSLEVIGVRILHRYDIFIVSSWYHIPRIKLLLKRKGVEIPEQNFIESYENINIINILIEPLAFLAAFLRINRWPIITSIKRCIGYNV